jgi:hypothetical protein
MAASGYWETLDRLGLSQYHDGLVQEAFDSWDVLADITEEDLYVADHLHQHYEHLSDVPTVMPWV